MAEPVKMEMDAFIQRYCDHQICDSSALAMTLKNHHEMYNPDGWMLLECQDLSSSYMGSLTILPYGPANTYKEPPTGLVSPRGLASDMSMVVAVTDNVLREDAV